MENNSFSDQMMKRTQQGTTKHTVRVLFANDHLGHPGGVVTGGGLYLPRCLPYFDRSRYEPSVAIFREYHPVAERLSANNIDVTFFGRKKWDPRVLFDLIRLARRTKIDVLHVNGMKAHFWGRLASLLLGIPVIIHLHFAYQPKPAFVHAWLARYTAMVLTPSTFLRDHAVSAFHMPEHKVQVCGNPMDIDRFANPELGSRQRLRAQLGFSNGQPVVIVVGRVVTNPNKGQRTLIRSMPRVLEKYPNATLVVVGDGHDLLECKKLALHICLDQTVKFLGQRSDVPELLAMADIAVVPSENMEAFGYVAIEAMSAGKPVIASNIGALTEILQNSSRGLLAKPGDRDDFARAICRLIADPSMAQKLAEAGKRYAAEFTIERHLTQLTGVYNEILNRAS